MPNSPLLGYPELAEAQAIPATASNLIDRYLEAFATRPIVIDTAHTNPSTATTSEGTAYLVPSGATGAWTGWADSVALRVGGAWKRILPREGLRVYSIADTSDFQYDGADWVLEPIGPLDSLSDVNVPAPSEGDVLTWDDVAGEWVAAPGGVLSVTRPIAFFFTTTPTASEVLLLYSVVENINLADDFAGSEGVCGTNPTATFDMDVQVNGVSVGTISISTGGAFTFTTSGGDEDLAPGDQVMVVAPGSADATCADVSITLKGTL